METNPSILKRTYTPTSHISSCFALGAHLAELARDIIRQCWHSFGHIAMIIKQDCLFLCKNLSPLVQDGPFLSLLDQGSGKFIHRDINLGSDILMLYSSNTNVSHNGNYLLLLKWGTERGVSRDIPHSPWCGG